MITADVGLGTWNITTKTRCLNVIRSNIPMPSPRGKIRTTMILYVNDMNDRTQSIFYPKNEMGITTIIRMLNEDFLYDDIRSFLEL